MCEGTVDYDPRKSTIFRARVSTRTCKFAHAHTGVHSDGLSLSRGSTSTQELGKERAGAVSKRSAAKKLRGAKNTTFVDGGAKRKFTSDAVFKELAAEKAGAKKPKKEAPKKRDEGSALRL